MRALAFAAAVALIGSAAGAQTMNTKETMTTPMGTTTTTTRTHTMPMAKHHMMGKSHAMRHCTTKMRHGKKMRTCKTSMMHNKMGTMHKM